MGQYEYKVLPTPRRAKRAKGVKGEPARFAHALTATINEEAQNGWEYYKSETLPMEAKQGLFKGRVETFQSLLVFRRVIVVETDPLLAPSAAILAAAQADAVIEDNRASEPPFSASPDEDPTDLAETLPESEEVLTDLEEAAEVAFDTQNIDPLKAAVDAHRGDPKSE